METSNYLLKSHISILKRREKICTRKYQERGREIDELKIDLELRRMVFKQLQHSKELAKHYEHLSDHYKKIIKGYKDA